MAASLAARTRAESLADDASRGRIAVPLDPLHAEILQIASGLPEAHLIALAGGGAMLAHDLVDRRTVDIDLFTPDADEVARLGKALVEALTVRGMEASLARSEPTFVQLQVTTGDRRTTAVEIAMDARLRPLVQLEVGPVLHPDELAADKVLALFGRAAARDLVDVSALASRYELEKLLKLAEEKDRGFDRVVFSQALLVAASRSDAAFRDADVSQQRTAGLRAWARDWSEQLARTA
jgi:predicted nucleotidyltransferase component of viral defense system